MTSRKTGEDVACNLQKFLLSFHRQRAIDLFSSKSSGAPALFLDSFASKISGLD